MPMVQITMLAGRTAGQKRNLAKRITDALVDEAGARREGIVMLRFGRRTDDRQEAALVTSPYYGCNSSRYRTQRTLRVM